MHMGRANRADRFMGSANQFARCAQDEFKLFHKRSRCSGSRVPLAASYAWLAASLPSAACAAASRAIGTRNGEHDT